MVATGTAGTRSMGQAIPQHAAAAGTIRGGDRGIETLRPRPSRGDGDHDPRSGGVRLWGSRWVCAPPLTTSATSGATRERAPSVRAASSATLRAIRETRATATGDAATAEIAHATGSTTEPTVGGVPRGPIGEAVADGIETGEKTGGGTPTEKETTGTVAAEERGAASGITEVGSRRHLAAEATGDASRGRTAAATPRPRATTATAGLELRVRRRLNTIRRIRVLALQVIPRPSPTIPVSTTARPMIATMIVRATKLPTRKTTTVTAVRAPRIPAHLQTARRRWSTTQSQEKRRTAKQRPPQRTTTSA
mmetsp:Transcript_1457/g.2759  ORF Transcript_1457/g.2759 Transcript_1457/m.2759 type:complete len:308 (-) Transcript_1457:164-1087(-)